MSSQRTWKPAPIRRRLSAQTLTLEEVKRRQNDQRPRVFRSSVGPPSAKIYIFADPEFIIGIYLSQLQRYKKLPDLIDPTAPNKAVGVDPVTSNLDAPAHPEVFSTLTPLLPSMSLEPLINVHKQRRIAGVIKTLVAGQHLASRMQFEIDKKLYQRCQRLRGLDSDTLQRALAIHSE